MDIYSVEDSYYSFISPNSLAVDKDNDQNSQKGDRTSGPSEIGHTNTIIKETVASYASEIATSSSNHQRVERSADPILSRTAGIDNLLPYKNVEDSLDGNDVELSGRIGNYIQPSKTNKDGPLNNVQQTTTSNSGEERGAPQARSLPLQEPQEISPSATMTAQNFATLSPQLGKGRQANPDIQDIITGIVKLLNGNVNVQANTGAAGRPLRPISTRINNRGPPRITDVPALPPDFDVPAPLPPPPILGPPPLSSTRLPTPYPFDVPHHNNMSPVRPFGGGSSIPLSEQVIPGSKRPGFYRPVTIPPWNRRRPPNRRPMIPSYKPMPQFPSDMISLTSEKPVEDILTLDLGSHLSSVNGEEDMKVADLNVDKSHVTESAEITTDVVIETSEIDREIMEFEKNKEKPNKLDKYTSKTTLVTPTFNTEINSETDTSISVETSGTVTETTEAPSRSKTSQLDVSEREDITPTSSKPEEIVPTSVSTSLNETVLPINRTETILESSIQEIVQTLREDISNNTSSLASTETEKLPDVLSTNVSNVMSTELKIGGTAISGANKSEQVTPSNPPGLPYFSYRPRPGIVLDDTEYKPGLMNRQPIVTRPHIGQLGEIFDITVSAIQGPGASSAGQGKPFVIPDIDNAHAGPSADVITSSVGEEGFVSIDGKRTYLNLFGDAVTPSTSVASAIKPSVPSNNQVTGTGYAVVEIEKTSKPNPGSVKPTQRRPVYGRPRPSQPPIRIDTCIVGDDSTCDGSQHEICKTESGVSACHCRAGTARRKHRDPCRKIVSVLLSLRVDRLYDRRVVWANELGDKTSESYQQLSYEAERALESAMSMTPFSDEFLAAKVNSIYRGNRAQGQAGVFVNLTLQLDENADTSRPTVKGDIQKHLLGVIQRRSNNVGNSALWVDSPPGSVSNLQDLDECSSPELHDCHALAKCINVFGGFKCECGEGYRDPWLDNKHRAGRHCEQCSPQHCNNRGECKYQNGQEVCVCSGNYYGNQCELDGEVLGVAIGASVAAVIIIGLTLVCLVMWSRRWSREQKAAVGSPVFGYMATASNSVKTPVVGAPPYQLTLEDRLRWAQIADVMAQANHYAPEPGLTAPTRPSSALFGYPNLSMSGTLQHHSHGTLPPVPLPRLNLQAQLASRAASARGMRPLDNSSSSEEEDKADLLGRNFQVPRPKSRSNASIANQSGIYYDVDYDQNEIYKQTGGIPLSTYSMARPQYFRN
ncbi:hypothetical protein NQ315_009339 [Exocentrus adspersus]|uniref:EGF-like domain-containing protein n=1 Tax=Exocentrus adspersus TaxID=1586481 RepID=A0AAV8WGD2_9CUCU|nr:hypothetical protein NQ315_009339 [Exocentrus adspersus]